MAANFKLTKDKNNIATLTFDLAGEKVNILKSDILLELEGILNKISKDKKVALLVIKSAKSGNFIAGADINEIKDITKKEEAFKKVKKGQDILSKIAALPFPTLAYINGSCMGGGTELMLSCDFRVASLSSKTKIALPEVNLGIIPGFGGTQRLPRLVGLVHSLPLILAGKIIDAKKAYRIGLVDGFFPEAYEKTHLKKFIAELLEEKTQNKLRKRRAKRPLIEKLKIFDGIIFAKAKQNIIKKTKGQYPAPLAALKTVERSYSIALKKGLEIELEEFAKLVTTPLCKNLISLYFANEKIKKDTGVTGKIAVKEIKKAGVLGAGIMGGGIAWLYSKAGVSVRMKDISWDGIALGYKQINKIYGQLLKIRKYNKAEIANKLALVSSTTDMSGLKSCDIISEAVIEDIKIKKTVIKDLEYHISDDCIIASNTSSISITEMAKALKKPERFIGMHFFNPVNRMPLVEVILGEQTNKKTIASTVAFVKKSGKTPIVVKDSEGFLVNRILLTYINEAFYILSETGQVEEIDELIEKFGMPMGPFTLADTVGLDVGYKVAKILEKAYGSRMKVSPLIDQIFNEKELLGKKSGKGIYDYEDDDKEVNEDVVALCKSNKISKDDILDRLIFIMINEAARCIDEKIVASPEHLDMAMIMGTGFPPFRGGLLKYAHDYGIKNLNARLEELAEKYGKKFAPCEYLKKLAKEKKSFY